VTDRICVAQFGAPHGIRGELRLRSFTEDPAAITAYGPLESEDGTRRFTIEALRPAKDHFVARLAGVGDRDAAEKLTNIKLYVSRDKLPPINEDDTFYHADLVGLAAVTADGATFGTVTAVLNFGAGDILEIKPVNGDHLLLPFTDTTVPEIDMKTRVMVIVPPAETE
jgi:16S rRNA processing protein RimM